ncbi:MAG: creatininase family protein [Gemmatimonadetes bacterium]|nr:creatininase family protein [Gemmatimonadota bacterium]
MRTEPEYYQGRAKGGGPDPSWSLGHLPWPEVGRILATDPRLILPVGALVQHGPHLPLGTNTFIAERVAQEVSQCSRTLLAPTFHYGVWNSGKESYAGSTGIERKTLHRALNEVLAKWEDDGIQEFILLTAYQHEPHLDALLMAMTSSAITTVVNIFTIEVGDLLEASPLSEHGGELETSLMLYLAPSLVRIGQAADVAADPRTYRRYAQGRVATPPPGSRGTLGFPSRASTEKGEAIFYRYVESLSEVLFGEASPGEGSGG